jgi:hypothetical protein
MELRHGLARVHSECPVKRDDRDHSPYLLSYYVEHFEDASWARATVRRMQVAPLIHASKQGDLTALEEATRSGFERRRCLSK